MGQGAELVQVYVPLLDEGTPVWRPTLAEDLGRGRFRLHATDDYDPEDETWEFLPGAVVRCEMRPLGAGIEMVGTLTAVAAVDDADAATSIDEARRAAEATGPRCPECGRPFLARVELWLMQAPREGHTSRSCKQVFTCASHGQYWRWADSEHDPFEPVPVDDEQRRSTVEPTYVEFTDLMSSYRPDDREWAWFWSDTHHGLAHRNYPRFWEQLRTRCPDGTVAEVIAAWTLDELQVMWQRSIYRDRTPAVSQPNPVRPSFNRLHIAFVVVMVFLIGAWLLVTFGGVSSN